MTIKLQPPVTLLMLVIALAGCGSKDWAGGDVPAPESMAYSVTTLGCANGHSENEHALAMAGSDTIRSINPSLDTLTPSRFLEFLSLQHGAGRYVMLQPYTPGSVGSRFMMQVPEHWLHPADVDTLLASFDDNTPTAPVYSVFADVLPEDHWTSKAIEAVRLVEGFRKGFYPSLWPLYHIEDSASAELDSVKQELQLWWIANSARIKKDRPAERSA